MQNVSKYLEDRLTIYADYWRWYNSDKLRKADYKHFTMNHKYKFVDPTRGVHT